MTPLHYACFQPSTEVARILLQNAARTDIKDYEGSTAMHVACKNGLHDTVLIIYNPLNGTIGSVAQIMIIQRLLVLRKLGF